MRLIAPLLAVLLALAGPGAPAAATTPAAAGAASGEVVVRGVPTTTPQFSAEAGGASANATSNSTYINSTANITTNKGVITAMLYDRGAPITVANYIKLADGKFYDGIKFHRIIDDFVIQTGDPNTKDGNPCNDGMGGSPDTIPLETDPNLTHVDGALGMARSNDPDSASSQFYITDGPQHQLDGNYAVFGVVIRGIEVVRAIASAPTYKYAGPCHKDHPKEDIVMQKVEVSQGYWVNITVNKTVMHVSARFTLGGGGAVAGVLAVAVVAAVAGLFLLRWRRRGLPAA